MGLDRFREFEQMDAGGTTYLNTYFVRADQAHSESLHFHELARLSLLDGGNPRNGLINRNSI